MKKIKATKTDSRGFRDNFKIEAFRIIPKVDWNKIVRMYYRIENYDFWDDNEAERDNIYMFTAKIGKLDKHDLEKLENFKIGQSMFMTDIILTDFCNHDLIDEGQYIIDC